MRDREIIKREAEGFDPRLMPRPKARDELQLEVLLDCRDLLQKLTDKNTKKVITTEVQLNDKEKALLEGLSEPIQA